MTLTHNCNTPWADQSKADIDETEVRSNGLSEFGKDVVREMNRNTLTSKYIIYDIQVPGRGLFIT